MEDYILQVKNLKTYFYMDNGTLKAVDDVSFNLRRDETIGIIGESGCGKSVTASSILRIIQNPGKTLAGEILFNNGEKEVNLVDYGPDSKEMRSIRGQDISMIFQEPMASLAPVYTIGAQMMEAVMVHQKKKDKKAAKELCMEMLREVGMPDPEQKFKSYPHQLSGGQCQRAMIALAMVNRPKILIADEPTTALDVTVQAQITASDEEFPASNIICPSSISRMIWVSSRKWRIPSPSCIWGVWWKAGSAVDDFQKSNSSLYTGLAKFYAGSWAEDRINRSMLSRGMFPYRWIHRRNVASAPAVRKGLRSAVRAYREILEVEPGHFVRCFH